MSCFVTISVGSSFTEPGVLQIHLGCLTTEFQGIHWSLNLSTGGFKRTWPFLSFTWCRGSEIQFLILKQQTLFYPMRNLLSPYFYVSYKVLRSLDCDELLTHPVVTSPVLRLHKVLRIKPKVFVNFRQAFYQLTYTEAPKY